MTDRNPTTLMRASVAGIGIATTATLSTALWVADQPTHTVVTPTEEVATDTSQTDDAIALPAETPPIQLHVETTTTTLHRGRTSTSVQASRPATQATPTTRKPTTTAPRTQTTTAKKTTTTTRTTSRASQ